MNRLFHFEKELNFINIIEKKRKYGIKIFKLCSGDYTCQYKIYAGKKIVAKTAISTKVVLELMKSY